MISCSICLFILTIQIEFRRDFGLDCVASDSFQAFPILHSTLARSCDTGPSNSVRASDSGVLGHRVGRFSV